MGDVYMVTQIWPRSRRRSKSALGMEVLVEVLYPERSLRAEKPFHALGVEVGSADLDRGKTHRLMTPYHLD